MKQGVITIAAALAISPALQDYLESILELSEQEETVRVTDLAARLKVAKASVTQAMRVLADRKLVRQEKYGPIELTELGREQALRVRRRHNVVKVFLVKILNVPPKVAETDACLMEHVISSITMERLVEFLESRVEPEGASVLLQSGKSEEEGKPMDTSRSRALSELSPGMKGKVIRVASRGELRRRILDMGVVPGAEIRIDGVAPLGDPLEITVRGYHLSLRKSEAADIYVEVE